MGWPFRFRGSIFSPFRCVFGPKSRFGCVQASPVVFRSGSVGFLCALPFVFQEGLDSFSGRGFGKPSFVVLLSAFVPSRVHPWACHPWFGVSPVREGYVALATRVRGGKRAKPSRCPSRPCSTRSPVREGYVCLATRVRGGKPCADQKASSSSMSPRSLARVRFFARRAPAQAVLYGGAVHALVSRVRGAKHAWLTQCALDGVAVSSIIPCTR